MWTYQLTSGEACGQTTLAAKLVPLNSQGGRDEMRNRNISAMMHLLEICSTTLSLTQYGFGKDIFVNHYFSGVQSYHNSFFSKYFEFNEMSGTSMMICGHVVSLFF